MYEEIEKKILVLKYLKTLSLKVFYYLIIFSSTVFFIGFFNKQKKYQILKINTDELNIIKKPIIQLNELNKNFVEIKAEKCEVQKNNDLIFYNVFIREDNITSYSKIAIYDKDENITLKNRPIIIFEK